MVMEKIPLIIQCKLDAKRKAAYLVCLTTTIVTVAGFIAVKRCGKHTQLCWVSLDNAVFDGTVYCQQVLVNFRMCMRWHFRNT
jgi:hypothetical protein